MPQSLNLFATCTEGSLSFETEPSNKALTKAEASSQREQYANNSAFAEKETAPSLKSEANVLSFKQYRQNSAAQSALPVAQTVLSIG